MRLQGVPDADGTDSLHFMAVDRFAFDVEVLSWPDDWACGLLRCRCTREAGNSTVRPVADSISMAFDVLRVRGREVASHPASVVTADEEEHAPARERILDEAFGASGRPTPCFLCRHPRPDPVAAVQTNEVSGTASRLTHSSHRLLCGTHGFVTELMEMAGRMGE